MSFLGPVVMGVGHPAVVEVYRRRFSPSCFLVEISEDVRLGGPWRAGNVLVYKARSFGHAHLVVTEV